jgi:hypothetical protein
MSECWLLAAAFLKDRNLQQEVAQRRDKDCTAKLRGLLLYPLMHSQSAEVMETL